MSPVGEGAVEYSCRLPEGAQEIPPELAAPFERLGIANGLLYRGPLFQIHDPQIAGTKKLAAYGLMSDLRKDGIQDEAGASVRFAKDLNAEGSYFAKLEGETAYPLQYRIHGGHRATMGTTLEFRFSHENTWGELPRQATPENLQELAMRLKAMQQTLDAALSEKRERLERAASALTEPQKETVATALMHLGATNEAILFGLSSGCWFLPQKKGLEIEKAYIEKLDALLDQVAQLDRLEVRLNPKVIKAKVSYIDNVMEAVEKQTFNRDLQAFLDGIPQEVHGGITKLRGWLAGLFSSKKSGQQTIERQEEGQALFTRTQQEILGKLNLLKVRLSALGGDTSLGANPGSDEFVSTCLEFLDYEVTPVI